MEYLTQKSGNLMLVDADHFKSVNDKHGHHTFILGMFYLY
ncbi:hypothetical protein yaldo0001_6250 [Yersinia aldovae ATCC 35236]|nr:hypothetical protein yaldo0001_6250 [Yersinia aldovae ATCC 35236]